MVSTRARHEEGILPAALELQNHLILPAAPMGMTSGKLSPKRTLSLDEDSGILRRTNMARTTKDKVPVCSSATCHSIGDRLKTEGRSQGHEASQNPFAEHIQVYTKPDNFKLPEDIKKYSGDTCPIVLLADYTAAMDLRGASRELMAKALPIFLTDSANTWFDNLPPGSVSSYLKWRAMLHVLFFSCKRASKTIHELASVRQRKNDSLAQYYDWFNKELILIDQIDNLVVRVEFLNGLSPFGAGAALWRKLMDKFPESTQRLWKIVKKEVRKEESLRRARETFHDNKKEQKPIKEERMDLNYLCNRELVQESYDQDDENVINFGVQTKGDDSLMEISAQEYQRSLTLGAP
ncbi:OLC1v1024625C1 [Oldenlandia corymbosa var. corymbosa]|uniref:OLC1v1024625C1 n=1 Tax=Oldenlandia corymbosa var. corymbosa TaxID=529605 RepID=A0AAV1C588_OLDCO|nr:OLC1v1024625C1 [Oldenlandia corymbosa var. corymbosa]